MNKKISFSCDSAFFAEEFFPFGISRSGEFTREQAELLEKHGRAYQGIHNGTREPVNEEEQGFLAVCLGEKEPETNHEKAWARFCQKINKGPIVTAFGDKNPSTLLRDSLNPLPSELNDGDELVDQDW